MAAGGFLAVEHYATVGGDRGERAGEVEFATEVQRAAGSDDHHFGGRQAVEGRRDHALDYGGFAGGLLIHLTKGHDAGPPGARLRLPAH